MAYEAALKAGVTMERTVRAGLIRLQMLHRKLEVA